MNMANTDNRKVVSLDTMAETFGWGAPDVDEQVMADAIAKFGNGAPTALILDCEDEGASSLREAAPQHVRMFKSLGDYRFFRRRNSDVTFDLLIVVSPKAMDEHDVPCLQFFPRNLRLGVGCQKLAPVEIAAKLVDEIRQAGYAPQSIRTIGTIEEKKGEPMIAALASLLPHAELMAFSAPELAKVKVPNPSKRVFASAGCYNIAEASAKAPNIHGKLVIENQKETITVNGKIAHYTYALAKD